MDLGRIGIWSRLLRRADVGVAVEAARQIEHLGFKSAWFSSGGPGQLVRARDLLEATTSLIIGTSILNVYMDEDPALIGAEFAALDSSFPDRFILGLGIGHREVIDVNNAGRYGKPVATINQYLDGLDAASQPVPKSRRALAALGPRMLELARQRTAGALPYLTTPEHTRDARRLLGDEAMLAPEQGVLLETRADRARATARSKLRGSLGLSNYTDNLRRLGFGDADFANDGSDRLVDSLFAWGDLNQIENRIANHHGAGADLVCVQVITDDESEAPFTEWAKLAAQCELG